MFRTIRGKKVLNYEKICYNKCNINVIIIIKIINKCKYKCNNLNLSCFKIHPELYFQ